MPYSLIVDVFVAVLLVITIGYAIVLNRRLGKLRRDKAELEKLAAVFGDSTSRAEESIDTLKNAADMLQERMDQAHALRDDLAFLIDRGGKAADSLEDLVRTARDHLGASPRPDLRAAAQTAGDQAAPAAKSAAPPLAADSADRVGEPAEDMPSDAEKELLKAIRSAG